MSAPRFAHCRKPSASRSNDSGLAKIERRSCDRRDVPGGNGGRVGRQVVVGENGKLMPHRACGRSFARQVPICVVRQIDDRGPIGRGAVFDAQFVGFVELILGGHRQFAGKPLVAIGADQLQRDRGRWSRARGHDRPVAFVEPVEPAVQGVGAVIGTDLILATIKREAPTRNAVGDPSDRRAEILRAVQIFVQRGMAERDIGKPAFPVPHGHRLNRGAVSQDACPRSACIGKRHRDDLLAVGQNPENLVRHAADCVSHTIPFACPDLYDNSRCATPRTC